MALARAARKSARKLASRSPKVAAGQDVQERHQRDQLKIAQASLAPPPIFRLVSRSIQIRTTASGCRKQTSNSIISSCCPRYPARPGLPRRGRHSRFDVQIPQRGPGGPQAAHPVHPAARRGGRRAQVDARQRRPVRIPAQRRAAEGLPQRAGPGGDVAADVARGCTAPCRPRSAPTAPGSGHGSPARTARSAPRSGPVMSTSEPGGTWQ